MSKHAMVTPFEKMKILGMYSEAKKILDGKFPYPRMAIIYPSYVCNHNCVDCLYGTWNKKNHVLMDDRNFSVLIEALISLNIKSVEFSGGGEPTIHPKFLTLVNRMINEGIEMGLLTNGTMLEGALLRAVA